MTDAASVCFLLPGTLCDERLFDPMQSFWPSSGSHTRHLVASLHGLTPDVTPWLQKQLRALPDQFNVMGFSLGVILALRMIELAPERVQCLVLVAGNASAGTAAHRERARTQMQIWQREGPQTLAQQMIDQASPQASQNPMVRQAVLQMANDTPEAAFIAQSEVNVSRPDGLNTLSNWHGPLLLAVSYTHLTLPTILLV